MVREEVRALEMLGPLPAEEINADIDRIDQYARLLQKIAKPITDEEAKILVKLFGSDDAYGLAWTLVHIVETAPSWPMKDCLQDTENLWIQHLRTAAENAQKLT